MADTTVQGGLSQTNPADEPSVQTKPAAIKIGKNITMAPSLSGGLETASNLENMQKLYEQKKAEKESFMERLRDATAWWSGGTAGPGEALAKRAAERGAQADELFQMQNYIANQKALQEQNRNIAASLRSPQGGITGGTAGTTGGLGLGGAMPPEVQAEIDRLIDLKDVAGAQKVRENWIKQVGNARAQLLNNPAALERKYDVLIPDGEGGMKWDQVDYFTAMDMKLRGIAKDVKESTIKTAPNSTLKTIAGVESDNKNVKSPTSSASGEYQMTKSTFEALKKKYPTELGSATWESHNADTEEGKAIRDRAAQILQNDNKQLLQNAGVPLSPIAERAAWFKGSPEWVKAVVSPETQNNKLGQYLTADELKANGLSADTTVGQWKADQENKMKPYQVASTTNVAPPQVSLPEAKSKQVISEAATKEFATKTEAELAPLGVAIDKEGATAGQKYVRAADMYAIASNPEMKKMFGVLQQPGVAPFILRQVEDAVNAGQFGTFGIKNLSDNLVKANATPDQIKLYERMKLHLAQSELEWAQKYLKGQGSVSDAERELVKKAVGNVKNDPAAVLEMQAGILAERAKFDAAIYDAYGKYRDKNGEHASFSKFMRTDGAKVIAEHNANLSKILGIDASGINPLKTGDAEKPSFATKEEKDIWNKRYGTKEGKK